MPGVTTSDRLAHRRRRMYLALLPVLSFPFVVGILGGAGMEWTFEPPRLLLVLNAAFLVISPFAAAYLATRSFVASGSLTVLLLGCGLLTMGYSSLLAGWVRGFAGGADDTATIHNACFLFASILHLAGSLASVSGRARQQVQPARRRSVVVAACSGVFVLVTAVFLLAFYDLAPTFFIQGQGPTLLWQIVVALAITFFLASSFIFIQLHFKTHAPFPYWYSLALVLFAQGLGVTLLQRALGSPMNWAGRLFQYVGGVYFLIAVIEGIRQARAEKTSFIELFPSLVDSGELRQAEDALRRSEERSRTLAEATFEGIAITGDGRLFDMNEQLCRITGYDRSELLGMDVMLLVPPEERHLVLDNIVSGRESITEHRLVRKDGTIAMVEAHGKPFVQDGLVRRHTAIRDITERKNVEDALRRSELHSKLLSETAGRLLASENPQGIVEELCRMVMAQLDCHAFFNFLVDEQAGKLCLNACAGIPEEEARKIEWLDYGVAVCGCAARDGIRIVAEDIPRTPDPRTDLVKSYGIQAYACHPLMAGGRVLGTLSFGTRSRTHFSSGDLALMKTVTDQVAVAMERIRLIKELQQAKEELESRVQERTLVLNKTNEELARSNEALRDFASIASHDLQEPLRKVATFGGKISLEYKDVLGPAGSDYLNRMIDATRRMQSLLTALLEYSRVSTQTEPFREVDLGDLICGTVSDLEARIEKTGGEVKIGELPRIEADPTQMRQLFQNLIGNGLKFHKPGERPVVSVRCSLEDPGRCEIVIEDNGIGFEEQHVDRIFSPFQRLHGRSSEYEGTGMGLAICRKIVERHGGSITCTSAPGHGTTFTVSLPVRQSL